MSEALPNFEGLLREALAPVEPPADLVERLEGTLTTITAPHTTEQLVEGRDELSRILDGVGMLPDDRREALIMRFALGMDNREIARALGRSDGATQVLIHRAIKQLQEEMADDPE